MVGCRADPLWCLADWCQLLGYPDVPDAVFQWRIRFDDAPLDNYVPPNNKERSQQQHHEQWYLREAEVFTMILDCPLSTAESFQEWLTTEVLPSIEEHGYYPPPSVQQAAYQRWLAWFDVCFPQHYEAVCRQRPGGFSVLTAVKVPLIAAAEELIRQGLPVAFDDRPDRIVAAWWQQHRKRQGRRAVKLEAPLELPEQGGTVYVKVYGPEELDEFNRWFSEDYQVEAFPSLFADDQDLGGTQRLAQRRTRVR